MTLRRSRKARALALIGGTQHRRPNEESRNFAASRFYPPGRSAQLAKAEDASKVVILKDMKSAS